MEGEINDRVVVNCCIVGGWNGERRGRRYGERGRNRRRFLAAVLHLVRPVLAPSFPFAPARRGWRPAAATHPPPHPPVLCLISWHSFVDFGRNAISSWILLDVPLTSSNLSPLRFAYCVLLLIRSQMDGEGRGAASLLQVVNWLIVN